MKWWEILLIVIGSLAVLFLLSVLFYKHFFKRFWDIVLSVLAIIVLSPLLILLTIVGTIMMKGNPFFTQERPGKNEKIFKLIKFRTMTNAKDKEGKPLPDEDRLVGYGKILRKTSLDELPELINICIGQMSIIGPRPLLVRYLDRYNAFQHRRHEVRPGLTGYAQSHGRNTLDWQSKFKMDIWYVDNITFWNDAIIFFATIKCVFKHEGINNGTGPTMDEFLGN